MGKSWFLRATYQALFSLWSSRVLNPDSNVKGQGPMLMTQRNGACSSPR